MVGERIAIHAGAAWDVAGERWTSDRAVPHGRIVCTAVIDRVVTASDDQFFVGPFGWVLRDIEPATSEPIRGSLGLWRLSSSLSAPATTTAPSAS